MLQSHNSNSIGQNNTEQNKGRQNNTWIGDSHSKTRQHRPFFSHHKSVFPTQVPPQAPSTPLQHTLQQDLPACTTPSQAYPLPFLHPLLFPPSSFLPLLLSPRRHFPCSWQADIKAAAAKPSMKSKLFGNKPTPSTQASQHMPHHTSP